MKCEQCRVLIEDYFYGELDPSTSGQIDAHISSCVACAGLAAQIKQESELFAMYRRDVDVTPALWISVQSRIEAEKRTKREKEGRFGGLWEWLQAGFAAPRLSPGLAAALVIVTIGITVGVMSYLQSRTQNGGQVASVTNQPDGTAVEKRDRAVPEPEKPGPLVQPPDTTQKPDDQVAVKRIRPVAPDPDRLVREAEQKYRAAIGILARGLKDRRQQLDPETRAQFDIALAEIDQTIEATRVAVRKNPADPIAVGYLLAAYSKKVDFLRDTARYETEGNTPF
jgi:hypothetical protein